MNRINIDELTPQIARSSDEQGRTPLHFAVAVHDIRATERLLQLGATPDSSDRHGNTPLSLSATTSCAEIVALLLSYGANVNIKDCHGRTPLQYAQTRLRMLSEDARGNARDSQKTQKAISDATIIVRALLKRIGELTLPSAIRDNIARMEHRVGNGENRFTFDMEEEEEGEGEGEDGEYCGNNDDVFDVVDELSELMSSLAF